uniref:Tight junction protein ZO-1 n=1 Tax=Eptatretus burgeri TaxID=7764 RepID=A0A8C4RCE8_EPTBU
MSYGGVAFKKSSTMEETVIWEQHTVNLHRAPNIGFGVAVSGGRDNPHFQSGETSIVISDVLQGSPADGLLEENDRVMMVNGVAMDNVEHAFAVQQLRKSGKTVQLTVRRKRLVQLPLGRQQSPPLRRHGMEDEYSTGYGEDEDLDRHSNYSDRSAGRSGRDGRRPRRRDDGGGERREGGMGRRRERSRGSPSRSRSRGRSASLGSLRSVSPNRPPRPLKVMLVKSKPTEGYGLRLGSHIYVKDIGGDGLAARDGSIQEGDIVLKINGTVTENMSLADARKLIEKSKGKLRLVVQRDERKTLTNMPELDDSLPSSEDSDRDDISDIHSLHSDHSNQDQPLADDHSRSPHSAGQGSGLSDKAGDQPEETRKNDAGHKMLKMGAIPTPFVTEQDWVPSPKVVEESKAVHVEDKATPPPDPKPVFAQSGQPDVDLPVSPTEGYQPQDDDQMFSPTVKLIRFCKGDSVGLRLAGGNDVGIFVAGVTTGSPAAQQGLQEGDQILGVNNVDFRNIVREEAVLYLLDLPKGEEVTVHAQRKRDVYQRIVESDVGDSFYIRTHFDYEKESPYGLTFSRGEVFRVVDTLYNGKLGSWLAIRIGKNNQEVERGIIPNKNRAEQLATVQNTSKMSTSDRADFWRIRGLRAGKKNLRKSREDLSVQPVPTKFPAYERVVLREAGFLRPVVVLGPIADVSREKLSREQPDLYEIARCEPRDAGMDQKSAGVIRLHTIKEIIDKDKHALLDITPGAVDRLNYAQWYPIVVFLNPDSKSGVKTMRQRLTPESHKSSRKLHERAVKLRKNNWHLFTAVVNLNSMNEGWYGALKDVVTEQQNQLVWVSEGRADIEAEDLDLQDDRISHLSAPLSELSLYSDSRHTSDFEDTDTEGGTYTDQELDESVNERETEILPVRSAVSRSSEPVDEELPYGYRPEHPVAPVSTHSQQVPAYDTHQFLHQRVEAKRESPVLRHSSPPQEMSVRVPAGAMTDPRWGQGEPVPLPRVQMDSLEEHRTSPDPQVLPPRQWSPEMVAPKPRLPRSNSREMLAELSHTSRQSEMSRVPTQDRHASQHSPDHGYVREMPFATHSSRVTTESSPRNAYENPEDTRRPPSNLTREYALQGQPSERVGTDYRRGYNDKPGENYRAYPEAQSQIYNGRGLPTYEERNVRGYGETSSNSWRDRPPQYGDHLPQNYGERPRQAYSDRSQNYSERALQNAASLPQVYDERFIPERNERKFSDGEHESWKPRQYDNQAEQSSGLQRLDGSYSYQRRPSPEVPPHSSYNAPLRSYEVDVKIPPGPIQPPANVSTGVRMTEPQRDIPKAPGSQWPLKQHTSSASGDDSDSERVVPKSVIGRVKMFEAQRPKGDVSISQVGVTDLQPASVQEPQVQASRTLEALRPANRYEQDEEARPEVYRQQQSYYPRSEQDHGVMPSAGPPSGRVDQLADSAHGLTSNQLSSRPRSAEEDGLDARSSRLPEKHAEPSTGPQNRYGPPTYPKPAILQKPAISAPAPPLQPKPELPAAASKPLLRNVVRDDITRPAQPPINGAGPLAYKPNPTPFGNRFTTTGAKPFQKKFDSPKFNHNLPEDGNGKEPSTGHTYSLDPVNGSSIVPRQQEFARSSYQTDNLTVAPKAIPVSSSVLEDESHTVLATARGVFDGHGGVLSSVETGVSIIIPKGAIADGTEQEIYFKVCKDNSILPPLDKEKGETLLSPLVMCGPHGLKFQKPVELRLPHCEPSNWQKAGDPNHKGSNCVSVLIDHF